MQSNAIILIQYIYSSKTKTGFEVMSKSKIKKSHRSDKRKSILDLSYLEACEFFMKNESYFNFDLPPYISFDSILKSVSSLLKDKELFTNGKYIFQKSPPRDEEKINHIILHNKDGKYAWRPIQLIHPVLYMSLVHSITKKDHWETICKRFKKLRKKLHIKCMSIPVISSKPKKKNKAEQILSWWEKVEQQSIKMSLDYEYLTHIDISNCYGSIYTHSVSWAIHGREEAKKKENRNNKKLIGNVIDKYLRDMSYGQTNGIPQGSVLMDFIAEMVLGYIDYDLTKKIKKDPDIKNYKIIRYRDDYRIFTNSLKNGEKIVKIISEILIGFGMSLNPNKTKPTDQVIKVSIKPDKLYWMQQKQSMGSVQKQIMGSVQKQSMDSVQKQIMGSVQKDLILIYAFSKEFPNSGSLKTALQQVYDIIKKIKKSKTKFKNVYQLISIIVDITYHNPITYNISAPIISQLIKHIDQKKEQKNIIEKIRKKFQKIPNTGYLDIWLQRVVIGFNESISFDFDEPICNIVANTGNIPIWESNWLKDNFKKIIKDKAIINEEELNKIKGKPIKREEFATFPQRYGYY